MARGHYQTLGGCYPFPKEEARWAWWARHIYFNRYIDDPKPVYGELLKLVSGKDYFVITTNVDHQFQRAGFDKKRLFYTQGDYGLFQSVNSDLQKTYDNEEWVKKAMEVQGFVRDEQGVFQVSVDGKLLMVEEKQRKKLAQEMRCIRLNSLIICFAKDFMKG